jgi:UDP:flavonoid glycosyltransferase YjiC (YdhE family)
VAADPAGVPGRAGDSKGSAGGLVVPWAPQAAVLQHPAVGAFVAHSGWGSVVEGVSGGVPMACRPLFGDQQMNARTVAELWRFGTSFDGPMTRAGVAAAVASLLSGKDGARMRTRARELRAEVDEAFRLDGGSMINFRKFVEIIVCARE